MKNATASSQTKRLMMPVITFFIFLCFASLFCSCPPVKRIFVEPLGRPIVAKVAVSVVSGTLPPDKKTRMFFTGVSGVDSTEWSNYESVILKFGNQSVPSDWYIVYDKNTPVAGTTGPTFAPSATSVDTITYIADGLVEKFEEAKRSGVTTVPLRLQSPGNPLPPPIFITIDFCYDDPSNPNCQ